MNIMNRKVSDIIGEFNILVTIDILMSVNMADSDSASQNSMRNPVQIDNVAQCMLDEICKFECIPLGEPRYSDNESSDSDFLDDAGHDEDDNII